jgi:hypothetical protein
VPEYQVRSPWVSSAGEGGLRRVLVQIDLFGQRHDFARIVVTAGAAHVVRALEFTAVRAFARIASNKRVVSAAHVALGTGDSVLRDSHVSTSGSGDMPLILMKK